MRFLFLLLLAAASALGQETLAQRIMTEAAKPSALEHNLRNLTDRIGGRVTGTPAMEKAAEWAVAAFKDAGADRVTTETYTIPISWAEGATRLEVVAPARFATRVVAVAWTPAVNTPVRARVVDVGRGSAEEFAKAKPAPGDLLLVHTGLLKGWEDLFGEYLGAPAVIERAVRAKAGAMVVWSTREHDLLYRHINTTNGQLDRLPILLIAREDGERIARLLEDGVRAEAQFVLPNHIGHAAQSRNVIAEIRGSEQPDEFVLLGAHLDSWELGTGALDNGCNAALVIDALRAIKASGVRPRRSLRFVLFSGEEQGMLGSKAYVAAHEAEMDRAIAAVIFDEGTGRTTGFSLGGRKDIQDRVAKVVAPFEDWGATTLTTDAFVGTDNLDFLLEGVPTLVANQEAANYLVNYHASSDTYDKVDVPQLKKHVAIAAEVILALAQDPDRLGRRQTRPEIEGLIRDTQLDEQMKLFGMWEEWVAGTRGRH